MVAVTPLLPLHEELNRLLAPLIASFRSTMSPILDANGVMTDTYSCVVHEGRGEGSAVPIGTVAAVIDCYDTLTIENLETAYGRIRAVKSIPKPDRAEPTEGEIHMTTGIIVARNSNMTLRLFPRKWVALTLSCRLTTGQTQLVCFQTD
jgi:hypothetical protein